MIELKKEDLYEMGRNSSKGNQLKRMKDNIWYKADYLGYEGLAEVVVSKLLCKSTLHKEEYVKYDLETIKYDEQVFNGCSSQNFLEKGKRLYTLQRLYLQVRGQNLSRSLFQIEGIENRIRFLTEEIELITGIKNFGRYLAKLMTIDAVFLNEDRHMHNVAVLADSDNNFELCPIFDNGACLLSDTRIEYPLGKDIYDLQQKVMPKTFSFDSFDDQLDAAEKLYGLNLKFSFTRKDIRAILDAIPESMYDVTIKQRVETIMYNQMEKYTYLFV